MASAWTDNGPVSLPSRGLVNLAAVLVVAFAILGLVMGVQAAFRKGAAPDIGAAGAVAGKADEIAAKPIVDLAPPTPAADDGKDDGDKTDEEQAKADALAAQTAAAQAIQAKPSKAGGNIDDVLASPTEKPPGPVKNAGDGAPVNSEVPF